MFDILGIVQDLRDALNAHQISQAHMLQDSFRTQPGQSQPPHCRLPYMASTGQCPELAHAGSSSIVLCASQIRGSQRDNTWHTVLPVRHQPSDTIYIFSSKLLVADSWGTSGRASLSHVAHMDRVKEILQSRLRGCFSRNAVNLHGAGLDVRGTPNEYSSFRILPTSIGLKRSVGIAKEGHRGSVETCRCARCWS